MTEERKTEEIYFKPPAKVVLVDDSELNRDFIRMAFKKPNYEIYTAADGLEGIDMINRIQPELILLDIMMPGLDGYDVAAVLKEDYKTSNIPIIFITALNDIQDKLRAFDAGAVDFVTKPFNHRELIARVKTNVENRRLIHQKDEIMRTAMEDKRNTAIARIAAGISHNINNMLGSAFGNIMLLEGILDDKLDDVTRDSFKDIEKSLEKIQLLARRFLVISGHQQPGWNCENKVVTFDLFKLVSDSVDNIKQQQSRAKLEYYNEIDPSTTVTFDQNLVMEFLQLISQEAIDSALKYVVFKFSAVQNATGKTVMSVDMDTDIVLPPNMGEVIFEPFALQTASVGSGLAFAVARNIIENNGGQVSASIPEGNHRIVFNLIFP